MPPQRPIKVVVFPAGWWHVVLNLEATLAVTESWGEPSNRDQVVQALREARLDSIAGAVAGGGGAVVPREQF